MDYIKSWFKIKQYTRRRFLISGIIAVAVAILSIFIHTSHPLFAPLWGLAMFGALLFPIGFSKTFPYIFRVGILFGLTTLIFIMMQCTISCGILNLSGILFFLNVMIMYGLTSIMWLITSNLKASILSVTGFTYLVAIVDHFVVQSRSYEIQFSDLASIGTAMSVAGRYEFVLSEVTQIAVMFGIVFVGFVCAIELPKNRRSAKHAIYAVAPVMLSVICGCIVFNQAFAGTLGITDKYWKYRGSELNGFWVSTIYSASATRIVEPQGYKESTTVKFDEVLKKDPATQVGSGEKDENADPSEDGKKKPHVIVIMNETFADVNTIAKYFGNEMLTDTPVLPFYDSLTNEMSNVIKGHAIASVHGGNTANSEFEFLTGMSMAFLPRSTVAYNFYLNQNNAYSIVDCFNAAGYKTVGMHPEDRTNWKRDSIYQFYGFDETYFKDNWGELNAEDDYFRGHISDKAVYDKIIDLYEGLGEDESLFTFAVTMQNHGGYKTAGFEPSVSLTDTNRPSINEYLSCINNSDAALEYFFQYLELQEEEFIVCFFGDHQPALSYFGNHFFNLADATDDTRLPEYVVPYMYWSNKDISCDVKEVTSLNFLSGYLLEMAGVKGTSFLSYVNQLSKEITAITAKGWIDNDMVFYPLSYTTTELPPNLQLYSSLQYNGLFDEENRIKALFEVAVDDPDIGTDGETTGVDETTGDTGEVTPPGDETTDEVYVDTEPAEGAIIDEDTTEGGDVEFDIAA